MFFEQHAIVKSNIKLLNKKIGTNICLLLEKLIDDKRFDND